MNSTPRIPVFYSFHYANDVFRVQQIRNIGVIDGNTPASANDWEQLKRKGNAAVEKWIDDNMKYRRCVVVLIGAETASREWVKYEIRKAWVDKRGLLGVYIHNLKDPRTGACTKGANPFTGWTQGGRPMADLAPAYDPNPREAYGDISRNLESWINTAVERAKTRTV
jgi:hypothetical protein